MPNIYVITSAQSYASPHGNFLEGLEKYASERNAELIFLPMIGQSASQDIDGLHPVIKERDVEYGTRRLNDNVQIEQFNVRPYQIDPITGLQRFAQRGTSLIFASPKQRMKVIPHSNKDIPKLLTTTGACTYPNYATGFDVSAERRRLGNIARRDHVYGALIVEIEDDEIFHLRNIRADTRGKFVDLGVSYNGDRQKKAKLEAIVFGDWHNGYTDPQVREANFEMMRELNPKRVFLHDFFDGHSINHHHERQLITGQIIEEVDRGYNSLDYELYNAREELIEIAGTANGTVYVLPSNHNDRIERYLDEGRFVKDPVNARIGFKLASLLVEGKNPVKEGMRLFGSLPRNVKFLERTDEMKVRGYNLGAHGDKGPGGRPSSMASKENDYGRSITGHTHTAEWLRDTYVVGTSTPLVLPYTKGQPTNWINTNALLWDTGTVQMVNVVDGKWRLKELALKS